MTENKPQFKHVPHGTNSPPLEATGEDKPMGVSCIAGTQQAGHVSDVEQRRGETLLCFRFGRAASVYLCLILLLEYFPGFVST